MKIALWFVVIVSFFSCSKEIDKDEQKSTTELISHVNPFIGTGGKGNTYPGAQVPFGMVQLSPDNGRNGWDWISGYYYPDSVIAGFSHLHLSGTGAGDLYDISFMPMTLPFREKKLDDIATKSTIISGFSHENEQASPGYYQVLLEDYNINVELTATTRTGLQRYTFNSSDTTLVRLDLGYTRNWDGVVDSKMQIVNDSTVVGYRLSSGWARDQRVYFASKFSNSIENYELYNEGELFESEASGKNVSAKFYFGIKAGDQVLIKTGISSVSIENAMENLEAEQTGFEFEKVRAKAKANWEEKLSKISIKGDKETSVKFYTAMYHSMLAPTTFSDINGQYKGSDGNIQTAVDHIRYTTFSLWDTFRALHPLLTIIDQERVPDFVQSMLDHYTEYGQLPVWNMLGNETDMMMGYHAVPVIADAYLKGVKGFDIEKAYKAMQASAMQDKFGLDEYKELGYVSHDDKSWNVSLTMEYAFDDWCIAQVAKSLGKEEEYQYYLKRSKSYKNHYDEKTTFFRAKSSDGKFKEPFNPLAYHPEDYCEANAWQYHWYAPQDIQGLIGLMGGVEPFEKKLDQMFIAQQESDELPDWISGYIGQYVHGNEPAHHVPYLYQFTNKPWRTAEVVREVMDDLYTVEPDGLCGNEDCGQMSAWYIFSALGFYPVNPADGKYILGSPAVEEAVFSLPNDKEFKVIVKNQSKKNIYTRSISLNGKKLTENYISHQQIMNGGELIFEMASKID
ncbi:MAG: putative alpha-1,2-mannosidase [Cyclobacteriaceae bacterium]|jgi:predicted alpha-1,2-mannosidase